MFIKHYIMRYLVLMIILSGFTFGQNVFQLVPFNGTTTNGNCSSDHS